MKHVTILLAALVLVLGAHAITKADPPAGATKWQYLVVRGLHIALGERDGVPGPAVAECAKRAGAEVVLTLTACYV